jgi:hypothetical protein
MPQKQGAGTIYTGGPGSALRGPIYVKTAALPGQNSNLFGFTPFMDSKGEWALRIANILIPAAQVLTLHSVPIDLSTFDSFLGAPGVGNLIVPDFIVAELKFNTIAFASGGAVSVSYGSGGPNVHTTAIPAALVTAAQSEIFETPAAVTTQQQASAMVNVGLFLAAAGADFTTGDGALMLRIGYRIFQGF